MELKFSNRYWTILLLYLDHDNKEFYLQNIGMNEEDIIKRLKINKKEEDVFKKIYCNGFEKDISSNELKLLFEYCITNMTVLGVYEIRNSYNRDQNTINSIKENEKNIWLSKGYKEILHCDKQPIFDFDRKNIIINKRDYLSILNDNISVRQKNFNSLEKELFDLDKQVKNNKETIKRQLYEIKENNNKIKVTNENLQDAEAHLTNVIERYKKGEKICDSQLEDAKKKWPEDLLIIEKQIEECNAILAEKQKELDKLNNDIYNKKEENANLESEYKKLKSNYVNICNKTELIYNKIKGNV